MKGEVESISGETADASDVWLWGQVIASGNHCRKSVIASFDTFTEPEVY
jgi:hypothetical protein